MAFNHLSWRDSLIAIRSCYDILILILITVLDFIFTEQQIFNFLRRRRQPLEDELANFTSKRYFVNHLPPPILSFNYLDTFTDNHNTGCVHAFLHHTKRVCTGNLWYPEFCILSINFILSKWFYFYFMLVWQTKISSCWDILLKLSMTNAFWFTVFIKLKLDQFLIGC